jgi:hypothetical protein
MLVVAGQLEAHFLQVFSFLSSAAEAICLLLIIRGRRGLSVSVDKMLLAEWCSCHLCSRRPVAIANLIVARTASMFGVHS